MKNNNTNRNRFKTTKNEDIIRILYKIRNDSNNKFFIETCFFLLKLSNISQRNLNILANLRETNRTIAKNHKFSFPILKEVNVNEMITRDQTYIKGKKRYYDEKHFYKDRAFLLSNDWYYPGEGKIGTKDTKTPLLDWIVKIVNFSDKL
ncbi:hypothetical protein M0P25_04225 [archaeon]|jgi:hypothetical protein|nr:hypothetical protein [archaeon]MCK9439462.1 hypothetical protein [Patescibacteria group bacterium]